MFVADSKDVDSSVLPSASSVDANTSFTERVISSLLGEGCQDDKRYSRVWELK